MADRGKNSTASYIRRRLKIIRRKIAGNYYVWVLLNSLLALFNKNIFKKHCLQNLLRARDALNTLKINYWLTDGTLLGFYREGDFITGDKDVDIGVMIEDWSEDLIKTFQMNGLKLLRINGNKAGGLEYTFTRRGVNLDVFFFYREKDYVWHATWLGNQMIRYKFPPFKVKEAKFLGHGFSVPEDTEAYLVLKYGANWRTPDKNWNWAKDPENIF